jgi:hypothetical protein
MRLRKCSVPLISISTDGHVKKILHLLQTKWEGEKILCNNENVVASKPVCRMWSYRNTNKWFSISFETCFSPDRPSSDTWNIYDDGIHIKHILALWLYINFVIVRIFLKLSPDDGLSQPKHVVGGAIKILVCGKVTPPYLFGTSLNRLNAVLY